MKQFILFTLLLQSLLLPAQQQPQSKLIRFTSTFTSFPDTARAKGHVYNKVLYPFDKHYSDSSVLIVVPPDFEPGKKTDLVFWFHGWFNHVDSAARYFELIQQFEAAGRNAILVLPESAKNAPDSYGGKLEQKNVFKQLLQEVLQKLKTEKVVGKKTKAGNIVLAGHSGAFRVMAFIVQHNDAPVKQVILFDGLYSQVDKYTAWIQADTAHRFINLYTNKGGGTDEVSAKMMQQLKIKNTGFIHTEETAVTKDLLKQNQVIFIHSFKEHNDVINRPGKNFRLFLENCAALKTSSDKP